MSRVKRCSRLLAAVALALVCACLAATPAAAHGWGAEVTDLEVSGRGDDPLGVDDTAPTLSWRVEDARDGWEQAAYQIQAARTERELDRGRYLWDSGKVRSSDQIDIRYGGPALESRDTVVWQVRVWSTDGDATRWSREASWEMGLLERSDWGGAKWIEYPGRNLDQPLPIFARQFTVGKQRGGHHRGHHHDHDWDDRGDRDWDDRDNRGHGHRDDHCDRHDRRHRGHCGRGHESKIAKARLYLSGIGLHEAELNGKPVTDEALAPGNSNYQLSTEYRTYDVTRMIRRGSNTLGVELGHGTAFVRRSITNPETGRNAPYSWWQSFFTGSGTLTAPASAGDTNVKVSSVEGYYVGGTINVDTGDAGVRLESRRITSIGTAATSTSLARPAAAGDTNVKLDSVDGMAVGQPLHIGAGSDRHTATITDVGTAAVSTTLAADSIVGEAPPPPPSLDGASWIWNVENASNDTPAGTVHLRRTFTVDDPSSISSAQLRINGDDSHVTYVNGEQVAQSGGGNNAWRTSSIVDVKPHLVASTNVIAIAATNGGGPGSLIGVLELDDERIVTDTAWKALEGTPETPPAGWNTIGFDDSSWPAAFSSGLYGIAPWNRNIIEPARTSASNLKVASVAGFEVGDTIVVDSGADEETRTVSAVGTAGANGTGITVSEPFTIVHSAGTPVVNMSKPGTGVTFEPALNQAYAEGATVTTPGSGITLEPALDEAHASGALVTGSGDPTASTQPTAGAAVTPRMIARLEITKADGSVQTIVSDRSWKAALGPTVYDMWFSGSDYDSRREQRGWTEPRADLSDTATRRDGSPVGWSSAGIAPPPNLTTALVWRAGEPVRIADRIRPVSITQPRPGVWVFDFGQNFAGWPELNINGSVPAGTTIKMQPAESLNEDGTVNQESIMGGGGGRGTDIFATYTTHGDRGDETWHPEFNYFGMQWVQVTGLPEGYRPTKDSITGLQLHADTPVAGGVETSNDRINRIHRMARYSIMSNMFSTFTDCPGREKLSYPADYTEPFGALHRNFDYAAYLRTTQRHLAEGQSKEGDNIGNVALKTPVYDWGYLGRFGDEINWGKGIVVVPWLAYETYGDAQTMERYYPQMQAFMDYIAREKAEGFIVDAALADWAAADTSTSGGITGTWGYYQIADRMAKMADLLGHEDDAEEYRELAENIKEAFNDAFYNSELGRYTSEGDGGTDGATQAAQALALDEGLVPEGERRRVLDALVELIYSYHPSGGGPHFSAGTIGMAPVVRALMNGGRDGVLWDVLQEDTYPSYGFFMAPTTENPNGLTTIPERWTINDSKNHMILLQIEEWFHSGLAGIRQVPGSVGYRDLVIDPRVVGDLTHVEGSYETPYGEVESEWRRRHDTFWLSVEVPPNTTAEVRVPMGDRKPYASRGARFLRIEGDRAVYRVPSGDYRFMARDVELGQ